MAYYDRPGDDLPMLRSPSISRKEDAVPDARLSHEEIELIGLLRQATDEARRRLLLFARIHIQMKK